MSLPVSFKQQYTDLMELVAETAPSHITALQQLLAGFAQTSSAVALATALRGFGSVDTLKVTKQAAEDRKLVIHRRKGQKLGIQYELSTLRITSVGEGPAKEAGVELGWIIHRINGAAVHSPEEIGHAFETAGMTLEMVFTVTGKFGVHLDGTIITGVIPGGAADMVGLKPGNILMTIEGENVRTRNDVTRCFHKAGRVFEIQVLMAHGQAPVGRYDLPENLEGPQGEKARLAQRNKIIEDFIMIPGKKCIEENEDILFDQYLCAVGENPADKRHYLDNAPQRLVWELYAAHRPQPARVELNKDKELQFIPESPAPSLTLKIRSVHLSPVD